MFPHILKSKGQVWDVNLNYVYLTSDTKKVGIGSDERPFLTINNALKYVNTNDTILIKPGIYKESINIKTKPIVEKIEM